MRLLLLILLAELAYGRITGFHVDDETCSGLLMNNKSGQEVLCQTFFGSLANLFFFGSLIRCRIKRKPQSKSGQPENSSQPGT